MTHCRQQCLEFNKINFVLFKSHVGFYALFILWLRFGVQCSALACTQHTWPRTELNTVYVRTYSTAVTVQHCSQRHTGILNQKPTASLLSLNFRAGIFKQSMGARNRVGIGLSYLPARLHRLAEFIHWNRFLGSINV